MLNRVSLCAAALMMACSGGSCGAESHLDGGADEDAGGSGHSGAGDGDGDGDGDGQLVAGPNCLVSNVTAEIAVNSIDKIDLLFMVDNSGSMREEQAALREQLPVLINVLTSGDRDGDGQQDFPPAKDLHVGVVSSDQGLSGIAGIPNCEGLGDDGLLNNVASPDVSGCSEQTYSPRFLSFRAGIDEPAQLTTDFQCLATLGTEGCGFQQQLENTLKAVWPGSDSRIQFLPDPAGFGTTGQAGPNFPNGDFIRNDPALGLSVIALILVTDEDDCSSSNTSHFRPIDATVPQDSPLRQQGLNTRCFFEGQRAEPNNIYDVTRYINGFKALREGNENLVIFGAITGVPMRLVTPERLSEVDFSIPAESDAFYDGLLAAPEMQEMIDTRGTPEADDDDLVPSCDTASGKAFPPRRIVQVAKGFGPNGFLQSICQDDFGPAIDTIIGTLSKQLGAVCLPRPLERDADGLTDCNVVWELPLPNTAPSTTPTSCGQLPFLVDGERRSSNGRAICRVAQLAVQTEDGESQTVPVEVDGETYDEGWYYDDFSESVATECTGTEKQRIAFSPGSLPPTGVTVKLECITTVFRNEADSDAVCSVGPESSDAEHVGDPCLPFSVPETGFDDSEAYVEASSADCGGGVCLVYHLGGDPREGCVPSGDPTCAPTESRPCSPVVTCATPAEIEGRVYCSCRCDAPEGLPECECPRGFTCVNVLENGGPEVQGGYCASAAFAIQ